MNPAVIKFRPEAKKSFEEAVACYVSLKYIGYQKIAFSYGAQYYNDLFPHPNKDLGKALGRLSFISSLYHEKEISD